MLRRIALGVLTVALLATAACAAGYSMQHSSDPGHQTREAVRVDDTSASPGPDAIPSPSESVAEPPRAPAPPRPVKIDPSRVLLERGASGPAVRDLQARLKQLAWWFGDVTGEYGDGTVEAVRGFQEKRGFASTGKVDQRTLDRLREMSTKPTRQELFNLTNVPGPMDPRCRTGRAMCIDKSTNTLRWVIDGRVIETVDVRFGGSATPTREGLFSVGYKSRDHFSQLYDTSMPFAMFFSGGQAVHYSPDFAAVGYAGASHGCVNVRDYDKVSWLFDEVDIGDKVVVYWS